MISKIMTKMATAVLWICSSSRTYRVFHVLGDMGAEQVIRKPFRPAYLVFLTPSLAGKQVAGYQDQMADNGIKNG